MIPRWGTVATVWLVAIGLGVGLWVFVRWQLAQDAVRETRCADLGGYVEPDTSLCRDRRTDAVLATWAELGQ